MANLTLTYPESKSPFDSIRHLDESGNEYWNARELMPVLGYQKWQFFNRVIENAIENIEAVIGSTVDHITPTSNMVKRPQGGGSTLLDYKLSRLACYHVALSCDSRGNDSVKAAKHYFAVKTREAELREIKPKTALELAREQVKLLERLELLEAERKLLEEENNRLAEVVDELFDYSSILRIAIYNQVDEKLFSWRRLKVASDKLGLEIKKVPCPRFVTKNLYSHDTWRLAYPEYRLPETTTLTIN